MIWIRSAVAVCVAVILLVASHECEGADQPQWGQQYSRNMVSSESGLPHQFDPDDGDNVKWSVPLGTRTYSTPVIARGRVFVGTNNDQPRDPGHQGDRGVVMCLDEEDGRLHWQLIVPKLRDMSDWPRVGIVSPVTVEGDRAYLLTNRGEVACLDLHGLSNGNDGPFVSERIHLSPNKETPEDLSQTDADIIWVFDMLKQLGVHQHDSGHCSILQHGRFLYACTSNGVDDAHQFVPKPDAPSLVVLDKQTGRLVATDPEHIGPQIIHCTWSSPSLGEVNGRPLVFFAGGDAVCYAFDALPPTHTTVQPVKLNRTWRFDCDPSAPKEDVHRFQDNRQVGPSHVSGMCVFDKGRIYVTVGGDIWHGKRRAWLKCIDATLSGDITGNGEHWSYEMDHHCVCTPAVSGDRVYVVDCARNVHCVDANTGKLYWKHRTDGEIWSSPLAADGKVYVTTRRGGVWIFADDKTKTLLNEIDFGEPINATPVAANGVLYIATMSRLYALREQPE